jgi:hypothetical protein
MDGCFAGQVFGGTVQRRDPPFRHFLHVDVESGLVELDHINTDLGELARLFV